MVRKLGSLLALVVLTALLTGVSAPPSAQAARPGFSYTAITGGTYLKVLDATVSSDFTAASVVGGRRQSHKATNRTADADVAGLLRVGAVQTTTKSVVKPARTALRSFARAANVNLLGGLIKADAVESRATTVARADGSHVATNSTKLIGIKIAGVDLPINIPQNFAVTIPGVASVTLNYRISGMAGDTIGSLSWALGITLLQPRAGYPAGVTLIVNPANHYLTAADPDIVNPVFGGAYGTQVRIDAADRIRIVSDRTAAVSSPIKSTDGETRRNQVAGVNVPGVLETGVVDSSTYSTNDGAGNVEIRNSNRTAGLNLLGGLIRADAIQVTARGVLRGGQWTSDLRMTAVGLVIAGQRIPINVSPNTTIDVAGLGTVQINHQEVLPGARLNGITGIKITLDTRRAGLPIGAVIEIAVAGSMIG